MNAPFQPGEPVWVELCTNDPARAEEFYSRLLGWAVRHEELGQGIYRMCSVAGRDVAGISDAQTAHGTRPQGWITYFAVENIEQSVRTAVTRGGELVSGPRYLPAAGTGATIIDPYGATFGLYQGESRAGVETLNTIGALCWNELDTGEPEQSVAYYQSLFGFGTDHQESTNAQPYTVLQLGDVPVAGVLKLDSDWPNLVPSTWIAYFNVESLNDAVRRAVDAGGSTGVGPFESAHGRLQLIRDPGGHTVCLIELRDGLRPDRTTGTPEGTR